MSRRRFKLSAEIEAWLDTPIGSYTHEEMNLFFYGVKTDAEVEALFPPNESGAKYNFPVLK